MTKSELLSNYTAEQLAEMVVNANTILDIFRFSDDLKKSVLFENPLDIAYKTELSIKQSEIECLQSEVEKYRKAFEDAKKERDCQIAEYRKKIEELTAENEKLKGGMNSVDCKENRENKNNFYDIFSYHARNLTKDDLLMFLGILAKELIDNGIDFRYEMEKEMKVWDIKIRGDKEIADFLPTEPIKATDMLINATYTREKRDMEKVFHKAFGDDSNTVEENVFDISELRQIAEHLLVYCNHNGKVEK